MKVTSLYLRDFRSFRGEVTLDFREPLTGQPRPITVLAGSNGSGKSTVLEVIRDLLAFAATPDQAPPIVHEAWNGSFLCLGLELDELPTVAGKTPILHVGAGATSHRPDDFRTRWPGLVHAVRDSHGRSRLAESSSGIGYEFQVAVSRMMRGEADLRGGIIFFPSSRQMHADTPVAVAPPPETRQLLETVSSLPGEASQLEQFWVWQNYLDLEEQATDHRHLRPFIQRIESVLGKDRRMEIRRGRVYVQPRNPDQAPVLLEQLPSGEKQILLLLGELARRSRPGMVCLIDEPEISLHPALQHALIAALRDHARREGTQFILATHSSEIVSALPGATLFLDHLAETQPALVDLAA